MSRGVSNTNAGDERVEAIDALTGLPNRHAFQQRLAAQYERAKNLDRPVSGLAFDVDGFGEINVSWLHTGGDTILAALAAILSAAARPSDIVVRDGGDQFTLILPDTDGEDAYREAERLRLTVESANVNVEGRPVPITVSVGVATATFEEADAWDLFVRAREAVHHAKESGGNRIATA
jgi:diguanylate cyclase (GGDEF)-like protein